MEYKGVVRKTSVDAGGKLDLGSEIWETRQMIKIVEWESFSKRERRAGAWWGRAHPVQDIWSLHYPSLFIHSLAIHPPQMERKQVGEQSCESPTESRSFVDPASTDVEGSGGVCTE